MHERTQPPRRRSTGSRARGVRAFVPVYLCALLGLTQACAHGQAQTIAELPPLDMPVAPPRIVEPIEQPPASVVSLPDEPRTNLGPRPTTPAQRAETPRPSEPARTDPVATDLPKPPEELPRSAPPTTLQTTPTQREGEVERRVRILVAQAINDLNRVNYQALNVDARNQYDTAKRFAGQAEEALRARNLVFASNLADKAAALATQLLGR
jgi:hypothetical protein